MHNILRYIGTKAQGIVVISKVGNFVGPIELALNVLSTRNAGVTSNRMVGTHVAGAVRRSTLQRFVW